MLRYKKIIALGVVASICALSFSGCSSDDSFALKAGDHSISTGQYIYYLNEQTYAAQSKLDLEPDSQTLSVNEELFKKQINGKDSSQHITEKTVEQSKKMLGALIEFDNLNLNVSDEDSSALSAQISTYYKQMDAYYNFSEIGIGQKSFQASMECQQKYNKVFDAYYADGGKEFIADDKKDAYTKEHGANYKIQTIPKSFSKSNEDGSKTDAKTAADNYVKQINEGAKTFDNVKSEVSGSDGSNSVSSDSSSAASFVVSFDNDETLTDDVKDVVFNIAKVGGPAVIKEGSENFYIVQRSEFDAQTLESKRKEALEAMTKDSFTQKLIKAAEDKNLIVNNGAVKKYNPKAQASKAKAVAQEAEKNSGNKTK